MIRGSYRAGLACGALLSLPACTNCASELPNGGAGGAPPDAPTTSTTGTPWVTNSSAATAGGGPVRDANGCLPWAIPPDVPEGWVEYTDWSCDCRFYVPGSKAVLPKPIEWEPCPPNVGPIDCKMMVIDWTDSSATIGIHPSMDRNPDGSAVLLFRRIASDRTDPYLLNMVADADGPVRTAIWQRTSSWSSSTDPGCFLINGTVRDGKFVIKTRGHDELGKESESGHEGVLGGFIDDLHPPVLQHGINELHGWSGSYFNSGNWVAKIDSLFRVYAYPWTMTPEIFVTSAAVDPEKLHAAPLVMSGDAIFWETSNLHRSGINVWDPIHGARPFIRWIDDTTQGAGNIATDGIDMVWEYGKDKPPGEKPYATRWIMTSPFTTDPAELKPRRLRSQPRDWATYPFHVGCGYAALQGPAMDVLVVRLSDGVSWMVPGKSPDPIFGYPIGLTCEEVFILADLGGRTNIARVRIDSLGPGMPPD